MCEGGGDSVRHPLQTNDFNTIYRINTERKRLEYWSWFAAKWTAATVWKYTGTLEQQLDTAIRGGGDVTTLEETYFEPIDD